jgi:hypothetical protein
MAAVSHQWHRSWPLFENGWPAVAAINGSVSIMSYNKQLAYQLNGVAWHLAAIESAASNGVMAWRIVAPPSLAGNESGVAMERRKSMAQ